MDTDSGTVTLTQSQRDALDKIIEFVQKSDDRVFILRGYAGTGKTTLVKAMVRELKSLGKQYVLLASTGRAAKVLSDASRSLTKLL